MPPHYSITALSFYCTTYRASIARMMLGTAQGFNQAVCNEYPCLANMDLEDMLDLPIVTVRVDFHFIESNGNNFHCSNPSGNYYAPTYAQQVINGANAILSNPAQSNRTNAPDLPDSRIRFVLYDEATPCNSVFIHQQEPTVFANGDALHILVRDKGDCVGRGEVIGDNIWLFNIHCHVFDFNWTDVSSRGGLLCHEFGHTLGLCHAHASDNSCPEIDPEEECGVQALGTSCGGDSGCIWGHSNNMMNEGTQNALVTSQWAQMYGSLFVGRPDYLDQGDCLEPSTGAALEISSNTTETWDSPKYIDTDIEIREGAVLIVECILIMGEGKKIIVNRGGRLFVQGGSIYGAGPECRWGGILVHGMATAKQPELEDARNEYYQLTSEDAGVVWINNAQIYWAQTAISTKGSGSLSTSDHFGGLVMVDNGDFIDNGRAVEFMRYKLSNKSYFNICNIELSETYAGVAGQGVSIWACQDISFTDVYFTGLKQFGIFGIDFNANIQSCSFDGSVNGEAIHSESTMPNSVINSTVVNDCVFGGNKKDIFALSTPNFINRFKITNNEFNSPLPASTFVSAGVQFRGESAFEIRDNIAFIDKFASVSVQSTGGLRNNISCNYFGNHSYASVLVHGNNERLSILGNDFYDTGSKSISLEGISSNIASIGEHQGGPSSAAGNCFTTPASAIVAHQSSNSKFFYWVHNLSSPVTCEKPTNNLSDSGTNNYELEPADLADQFCDSQSQPVTEFTDGDLTSARTTTATKKAAYVSDPTSKSKHIEYLFAATHQDSVLRYLVKEAFVEDDLDKADSLMLGEKDKAYTRGVAGLRTQRGDISGAEVALDSIAVETQDDEWFVEIMEINFKVAVSDTLYKLTSSEEDLMYTIAGTEESIMSGYACALLSLCKGRSCEFELVEEHGNFQAPFDNPLFGVQANYQVSIYPNPTEGKLEVKLNLEGDEPVIIEVQDLSGRIVSMHESRAKGLRVEQIEISQAGFYFIRVWQGNRNIHIQKIAIIE